MIFRGLQRCGTSKNHKYIKILKKKIFAQVALNPFLGVDSVGWVPGTITKRQRADGIRIAFLTGPFCQQLGDENEIFIAKS